MLTIQGVYELLKTDSPSLMTNVERNFKLNAFRFGNDWNDRYVDVKIVDEKYILDLESRGDGYYNMGIVINDEVILLDLIKKFLKCDTDFFEIFPMDTQKFYVCLKHNNDFLEYDITYDHTSDKYIKITKKGWKSPVFVSAMPEEVVFCHNGKWGSSTFPRKEFQDLMSVLHKGIKYSEAEVANSPTENQSEIDAQDKTQPIKNIENMDEKIAKYESEVAAMEKLVAILEKRKELSEKINSYILGGLLE